MPAVGLSQSFSNLNIEPLTCKSPQLFLHFPITKYILASQAADQLADIPRPNDIGFDHTHPHDFLFSGMAAPGAPSRYINVEPEEEEEGMPVYNDEADTTIHAAQGTDILRMLKLYQHQHINL